MIPRHFLKKGGIKITDLKEKIGQISVPALLQIWMNLNQFLITTSTRQTIEILIKK
jgi:hypothetical protein